MGKKYLYLMEGATELQRTVVALENRNSTLSLSAELLGLSLSLSLFLKAYWLLDHNE